MSKKCQGTVIPTVNEESIECCGLTPSNCVIMSEAVPCLELGKGVTLTKAMEKYAEAICQIQEETVVGTHIEVVEVLPGEVCLNGGVNINVVDNTTSEIISSNAICNGVGGGSSGTHLEIKDIEPGEECPNGGVVINVLDDVTGDVISTGTVCNGSSSSMGVMSVTGTAVDNTDPLNPIVNFPAGQFTPEQEEALLALIYVGYVSSITVSPAAGERGVDTTLNVSYNITSNDDTITTATITQGIGNVITDVNGGTKTVAGGITPITKAFSLALGYTRNGVPGTNTKTATYTANTPQWAGWSAKTDFTTAYADINGETNLQKFVQASAGINKASSPTGEYIWFISNKSNANVYDTNDFLQSQGAWGDNTKEFWTKTLTLTLSDGVTTAPVYLYRSRQTKTLTAFTYKIA